jgi:hypothetical protein
LSLKWSQRKKVKNKLRRMRGPYNWSSSSCPSMLEVHVQRVMDNVNKTNRCTTQLKKKVRAIVELQKSIIPNMSRNELLVMMPSSKKIGR